MARAGAELAKAIRRRIGDFLTWLFTPRPKAQAKPVVQKPPKPVKPPPPPPPPKPRIAGLSLTVSPKKLTSWGAVSLTAEVSLDQANKPGSGLPVTFEAPSAWDIKFQGSSKDKTGSDGRATATADIRKPKGPWKDEPMVFTARVSGAGEVQGSASASALVKPPLMPRITGFILTSDTHILAYRAPATLTAVVSFNEAVADKAGIPVRFEADPAQYAKFGEATGAGPWEAHTDSEGLVEIQVSLIEDEAMRERRTTSEVHGHSRDAFAGLDAEAGKASGGEAASAEEGGQRDESETADVPAAFPMPVLAPMPPSRRLIDPSTQPSERLMAAKTVRLTAVLKLPVGLTAAPGVQLEQAVNVEAGAKKGKGNKVRMHAQFGRKGGRGTHFGDRVRSNVDEPMAQQMLTDLKNDVLGLAKNQDLTDLWVAVEKASQYLMTPKPGGGSKSFYFGKTRQNRIDIEISGAYPYDPGE